MINRELKVVGSIDILCRENDFGFLFQFSIIWAADMEIGSGYNESFYCHRTALAYI